MKTCWILLIIAGNSLWAQGQNRTTDYTVVEPAEWNIPETDTLGYSIEPYLGAKSLLLKRKIANHKSASIAYPKGLVFKDGIIEMDIASPDGKTGFIGLAFRIKDVQHYETVYFRPGASGTINAIQYMPEKQAEFNWWDYEANQYQGVAELPLTEWLHVKAIVKGKKISIYLRNESNPVFEYHDLDPDLPRGSVGFWLGNSASGAFKNLKVTTF